MGITIPKEELDLCMDLARPGYAALSLTNDLYSWRKERKEAKQDGNDYVYNAIWVIMNERAISEKEAVKVCIGEINKYTAKYCRIMEETKNNLGLSRDLRAYIEAMGYSISGNLVWSMRRARYQVKA